MVTDQKNLDELQIYALIGEYDLKSVLEKLEDPELFTTYKKVYTMDLNGF